MRVDTINAGISLSWQKALPLLSGQQKEKHKPFLSTHSIYIYIYDNIYRYDNKYIYILYIKYISILYIKWKYICCCPIYCSYSTYFYAHFIIQSHMTFQKFFSEVVCVYSNFFLFLKEIVILVFLSPENTGKHTH